MPNIELYVILLLICLAFSAFFSGSETAFISLQRFRLEHLVNTDVRGAKKVAGLIERPERFLSVVLFGNTLVNAAAAALATAMAAYWWGEKWGIVIATMALTVVLLIFCEVTPKIVAAQHAERLSLLLQGPIRVISWLFTPFVIALSWIGAGFTIFCRREKQIPASMGFHEPYPDFPGRPVVENTPIAGRYGLSDSVAFGGNNAALIFQGQS